MCDSGKCNLQSKPVIGSLQGMKVICLFVIFVWHYGPENLGLERVFDAGARMVEVFFACSGVLMAYNHRLHYDYTLVESYEFWSKRIIRVWPLHAFTLLLSVLITVTIDPAAIENLLSTSAVFLLLQHAWCPKIALISKLSGASWYLSALSFCWLLTPTIACIINQFNIKWNTRRKNVRANATAIAVFFSCRVLIEYLARRTALFAGLSLHSNPFVRLLEYATAYAAGNAFFETELRHSKITQSIIELLAILLVPYLWVRFNGIWWRCTYYAVALLLTLSLCPGNGLVGNLLSCKALRLLSRYELSFYLLHQLGIRITALPVLSEIMPFAYGPKKRFLAALLATFLLARIWESLYRALSYWKQKQHAKSQ